jgi:DNA-binding LytR/AlgR family response regulator
MKVILEKVKSPDDEGAHIKAVNITEEIKSAVDLLENNWRSIPVYQVSDERITGESYMLGTNLIYYTESIDKRTYVYTKDECYETKYRLYELEVMLGGYFMRCSKSMIINLKKIKNVKSQISGRVDATMLNDEIVVISRGYVKEVKRRLGIG